MARTTRQSARIAASMSASATPTTGGSPIFSPNQSETPETSDGEAQKPTKSAAGPRRAAAANTKKRAASSDDEPDAAQTTAAKRPTKKRNVAQRAVVEIPARRPAKTTGKVRSNDDTLHYC